ncbi:MAG: hypothetical protein J6P61_00065 [Erysipelotrichaceae bacterium]|nr:hypothetical protein [Erysipelotrichaceae bacterium]
MYDLYNDIQTALAALKSDSFYQSEYRQNYEQQVAALDDYVVQLKDMGLEEEDIAHILYNKRQALARQYQEHTPTLIQKYINDFVYSQHRSALGWTFDQLAEMFSYHDIIETLTTSHGNLDTWLTIDHFTDWLRQNYMRESM